MFPMGMSYKYSREAIREYELGLEQTRNYSCISTEYENQATNA
jgi:hypothetical protein